MLVKQMVYIREKPRWAPGLVYIRSSASESPWTVQTLSRMLLTPSN